VRTRFFTNLWRSSHAAADFHELAERAAKRGLRVAFEALAWGRHINDYRDAWEVVRRADHPSIGLVLDTFHILVRGTDLRPIRAVPKDRIFLVQVADAPLLDMDYLSWSRHYRCFPGQGDGEAVLLGTVGAGQFIGRWAWWKTVPAVRPLED
jgi:sugar phosphate isomerase/epimerase